MPLIKSYIYSATSSPLDHSNRFTLHPLPLFIPTPTPLLWEAFSHAAITAVRKLLTHISATDPSQVLIYTAEWTEASWRERKCPNFETAAEGIWTRALSVEKPEFYSWATGLHKIGK